MASFFNLGTSQRVSFFELISQVRLTASLRPAFKYATAVLGNRHPHLAWLHVHHADVFFAAMAVLDRHFLYTYDSTFSENVYGLKRAHVSGSAANVATQSQQQSPSTPPTSSPSSALPLPTGKEIVVHTLSTRDKHLSLIFSVLVPYLKSRCDLLYESNSATAARVHADSTELRHKLMRWFVKVYPYLNFAYEGVHFVYCILYLFGKTRYFTPLLHLSGVELRRVEMKDMAQNAVAAAQRRVAIHRLSGLQWLLAVLGYGGGRLLETTRFALPVFLFVFRLLNMWYRDPASGEETALPIPPAPEPPKKAVGGVELPSDVAACPLCRRQRTNPAVASRSGYVFCYPCISRHVEEHGRCPVTHVTMSVSDVRRLYETQ